MTIKEMLGTHGDDLRVEELSQAIEALLDCAAHCNICADACLEEEMDMTNCVRACLDCADICQATASVLSRAGASGAPWLELVGVCADACANCASECDSHEMDHCKVCAEACRRCEEACRELLRAAS
jgi:hypothetical protein